AFWQGRPTARPDTARPALRNVAIGRVVSPSPNPALGHPGLSTNHRRLTARIARQRRRCWSLPSVAPPTESCVAKELWLLLHRHRRAGPNEHSADRVMAGECRCQHAAGRLLACPPCPELPPHIGDEDPTFRLVGERHAVGRVGELVLEERRGAHKWDLDGSQQLPCKAGELILVSALTSFSAQANVRVGKRCAAPEA